MGKLRNDQLISLTKELADAIEEQDETIFELTGERDAYKEAYEETHDALKIVVDKYEPKEIDQETLTKINNALNKPSKFEELRARKIEEVKRKKLEILKKDNIVSNILGKYK